MAGTVCGLFDAAALRRPAGALPLHPAAFEKADETFNMRFAHHAVTFPPAPSFSK